MELSFQTLLLNKAINFYAKYEKYAIWSLCGLITFYALRFVISQFLARYSIKKTSLLAKPLVENLPVSESLEIIPNDADLPNENLPDLNQSVTSQESTNLSDADSQEANSSGANLAAPGSSNAESRNLIDHTWSPVKLIPRELEGQQSINNMVSMLNYLESLGIKWNRAEKDPHLGVPEILNPTLAPARRGKRGKRLKTYVGPFLNCFAALPDLKDQAAVSNYYELHMSASEKCFEKNEYGLGIYHFVLLHFSFPDPKAHLDDIAKFVEKETYFMANGVLTYLMYTKKKQKSDEVLNNLDRSVFTIL